MKKTLTLLLLTAGMTLFAQDYDAQWKAYEEARKKQLPQTAIEVLTEIEKAALENKEYGQAALAVARKITQQAAIEGARPAEKIHRVEEELKTAPEEIKPILLTLRAFWYLEYYQQNSYRFMNRTRTMETPGEDFESWDLSQILTRIHESFAEALNSGDYIRKTSPEKLQPFLSASNTLFYTPTIFDVIAYEALSFYERPEQMSLQPEDSFIPELNSPILASAEEFLAWEPETGDAMEGYSIRLYQELLRFHAKDEDRSAFAMADLLRIVWAGKILNGEKAVAEYRKALEGFSERWKEHEIYVLAQWHLASSFLEESPLRAHEIMSAALNAKPKTNFASTAKALLRNIEAKYLQVHTERVWTQGENEFSVTYKNLSEVYFRMVPMDWRASIDGKRFGNAERPDRDFLKETLSHKNVINWRVKLEPTNDFTKKTLSVSPEQKIAPGFYYLFASGNEDFTEKENEIFSATVWVSDLSLVTRNFDQKVAGLVTHAITGEPVKGATVKVLRYTNVGKLVEEAMGITDKKGLYSISVKDKYRDYLVEVNVNLGDELHKIIPQHGGIGGRSTQTWRKQIVFFTDRALYRPGQTIHYKGIYLNIDKDGMKPKLLTEQDVTVNFSDTNGKNISSNTHKTNAYGSFSGTFIAPTDRLMGEMSINVTNIASTAVRVEEYKRPKFQVSLEAPAEAARLNDSVTVQGKAETYTGMPVDGAKVAWRVTRNTRWPDWIGFRRSYIPASEEAAIANGITEVGKDGVFKIPFHATPDPKVSEQSDPVFVYSVYADVTDGAGETRSTKYEFPLAYTALQAKLSMKDWQTPSESVDLSIRTSSHADAVLDAEGVVKIHHLIPPERVQRKVINSFFEGMSDMSDPKNWELGEVLHTLPFKTEEGKARVAVKMPAGTYMAVLETKDHFGKNVIAKKRIQVLDPAAERLNIKVPFLLETIQEGLQPGQDFTAIWGTGYDTGRAYVEIWCNRKLLQAFWTDEGRTQQEIRLPVEESMRGGFTLQVTQVRENRVYAASRMIFVPWRNKQLTLKWESFRSKLDPAQKETWTAAIRGADAEKVSAEMVATLYDASLDQFLPFSWPHSFPGFRSEYHPVSFSDHNAINGFSKLMGYFGNTGHVIPSLPGSRFHPEFSRVRYGGSYFSVGWARRAGAATGTGVRSRLFAMDMDGAAVSMARELPVPSSAPKMKQDGRLEQVAMTAPMETSLSVSDNVNLDNITARANLNETAFFLPHLTTDADGTVRMTFTMPEALTTWKFFGFAHDKDLRSGLLTGETVTSKDLMVQPNPPRFLREGDALEFTVKITNRAKEPQRGKVRLQFHEEDRDVTAALGISESEQPFEIPAEESRTVSWRLSVPDGARFLTYKAVAATDTLSDGEEGWLPVLPRRILVTESLPLPIRDAGEKAFTFRKLLDAAQSGTLRHQSLTVQMVSNPAWYAVMALPYLMEYPYECNEQTFNRFYANALAAQIAQSDPKIRAVFDQWRDTPALDSPLEKNNDLKSLMLEETPWLREGKDESVARRNVGILFDKERLHREAEKCLQKLRENQLSDGSWAWFPGGNSNDYITLYITTGFARLRHLGNPVGGFELALRAVDRLDAWIAERYKRIRERKNWEDHVPSSDEALYLYTRSFFLKDKPVPEASDEAVQFFLRQSREHWTRVGSRQSQGHVALALHRFADKETPKEILRSLRERSVNHEEMGMFWKDRSPSWWWYYAPIETQALLIEAFDEVLDDQETVEACRVWLLKQKQTQNWRTTKATADAVYALLLRGSDILSNDELVEVQLGGTKIEPKNVEAGTGFYEQRFTGEEVRPAMGEIKLQKTSKGVAWGSVHWQYFEDISKITPHEETPLKLKKRVYRRVTTEKGQELEPITGALSVGDEVIVRVELRVDRSMEFIHLKDQRGSGTEPVNVLSSHKYQDGLRYYESTRDTASHFFIENLPEGAYVFEYPVRIQHRGVYQTGIAEVQCMYAPEFNSHSESIALEVK